MTSSQSQRSEGYTLAQEQIKSNIDTMKMNRSYPRLFSLHSIQKKIGAPLTAEGIVYTRKITEDVLRGLMNDGSILSFKIKPKFGDGPEWVFVEIPKKPRGKNKEICTELA